MSQHIATRREKSEGGEGNGWGCGEGRGDKLCSLISALHRSGPYRALFFVVRALPMHLVYIASRSRCSPRPPFSLLPPLTPYVERDELKRPENSLRTARDRSRTRDRGIMYMFVRGVSELSSISLYLEIDFYCF